jgi:hypothetical protein
MTLREPYNDLVKGLTWREIIAEALRTAPVSAIVDKNATMEDQRLALADHILAEMRRHAKYGPL